jgi:hypothetical protein
MIMKRIDIDGDLIRIRGFAVGEDGTILAINVQNFYYGKVHGFPALFKETLDGDYKIVKGIDPIPNDKIPRTLKLHLTDMYFTMADSVEIFKTIASFPESVAGKDKPEYEEYWVALDIE